MSSGWPGGSNRAWRKIRARRLEMDGYRCKLKFPGCTGVATEVHHIGGRANVGDKDINLLTSACQSCNLLAEKRSAQDPVARPPTVF